MIVEIKNSLKQSTIVTGVLLYMCVWIIVINSLNKYSSPDYRLSHYERFLNFICYCWIGIHVLGILYVFIWAWM